MGIWCQVLHVLRGICHLVILLLSETHTQKNWSYVLRSSGSVFVVLGLFLILSGLCELLVTAQPWRVTEAVTNVTFCCLFCVFFFKPSLGNFGQVASMKEPLCAPRWLLPVRSRMRPLGQHVFARAAACTVGKTSQKSLSHEAW